ncbi:MAG: TonB-dependent receptor [Sphingobium sp.]
MAKTARHIAIGAGPLENALTQLARQAGWQILFDPAIVRGHSVQTPIGGQAPGAVLHRLLRNKGLEARWLSDDVVMILSAKPDRRATGVEEEYSDQSIVVTALKRETVLAETPVSMSVERGKGLAAAGVKDVREISRRHPGLTVLDTGAGRQRLIMRGVSGAGEPTVGVYYDESAVSAPGGTTFDPGAIAPDLDLVDIDRIEMLHGPHGTLYGASAMGGVVRVIFNRPDPALWSGEVRGGLEKTAGADWGGNASLVLNAPLMRDRLALRLSLYDRRTGGYIDNRTLDRKQGGDVHKSGGRLALGWFPDEDTDILASTIIQRMRIDDATFGYRDQGPTINNQSLRTPQHNDLHLYNVTAHRDLGDVSAILSISRYLWNMTRRLDYSPVLLDQKGDASACSAYFSLEGQESCSGDQYAMFASFVDSRSPGLLYQPMKLRSWSAELRLSSNTHDASPWTVGAYWERRREDILSYVLLADARTGNVVQPLDITGLRSLDGVLTQQALFGEWSARLNRQISLTLGGRLFHYLRKSGGKVDIPNPITGTGALTHGRYSRGETGTSLKVLLSYRPTSHLLLYSQISQGFRPGGVNITPGLPPDLRNYESDRLWNYELGMKANAFEQRLSLNMSLYRIVWSDMISPVASDNGAFSYNSNIGEAKSDGAEIELSISPDRKTTIEGRLTFLQARLTRDQLVSTSGIIARKGDRLPNVPDLAFSIGLQRREPLSSEAVATLRLDFGFTGAMTSAFNRTNRYFERTPSRTQLDAQLFLEGKRWDASLAVRNILGSNAPVRILSDPTGTGQIYNSLPRTVSMEITRHF